MRSREAVDAFITQTRTSTQEHLHTAQELSLLRHSLSDELVLLADQLESSLGGVERKPTLLEDIESLHRSLKELESVKRYVQIIEHALRLSEVAVKQVDSARTLSSLSEFEALERFVGSVQQACTPVKEVAGQQQLHILSFLTFVRDKSWLDMKHALSRTLLSAAEKLNWPQPVDYVTAVPEDRKRFEAAFLNCLKLQTMGEAIRTSRSSISVHKEGLYPLEALVEPVALRFKYHFEGTRQTNRLDKPEWYLTHVLNISHEHQPFMEKIVQPLLSATDYREVEAWREFTLLLLPLLERKLRKTIPPLISHPPVLAHTIYEALAFDSALREEGFDIVGTTAASGSSGGGTKSKWEGISEVILGREEWFEAWMEGERQFAMDQYMDIISSSDAWLMTEDSPDDAIVAERDLRPTNSARRVKALVEQITDRYSPLPKFLHRTRFFISVQLPILEAYHSRISSSLDAFETLSSSLMRAVPGALGSVGVSSESMGRAGDPQRLTSGVEGVQRLCKALVSARYISAACAAWGEELFFLELWAEINRQASLRSRVEDVATLPSPLGSNTDETEGTIFETLVGQYEKLAERAEDMIIHTICGEVEAGLKAHFTGSSSTQVTPNISHERQDDIALATTLLAPLALLSSEVSFLQSSISARTAATLYRRIASRLGSYILQRQIFYRGRGPILAESELFVETCQIALARSDRSRAEAPWRQLLQASRLIALEGNQWQKAVDATFGVTADQDWEEVMLDAVGATELSREEVGQVLRTREDCEW
ncbi:TIP-1 family-domain-containing protein [Fomitopsis serialis]|uniref:TIP-1 family-domain-containing protein n=1 Tax=Fomitopsis serialis TaxID=139415 RepID=UPI0020072050|nr:TIP-1 family-domain-containing protein [Neoantrodia serialis]KAH9937391.1 TIP-1 family-domain-containing protein [Neoantrodia serialis]